MKKFNWFRHRSNPCTKGLRGFGFFRFLLLFILFASPHFINKESTAMAAHAIYILDQKGKVIINRNYRGDLPSNVPQRFMGKLLNEEEEETHAKPFVEDEELNYVYITHNNLRSKYFCSWSRPMESLHLLLSLVSRYSSMFQRKFCKYCTKRLFTRLMCSFFPFPPLVMAVTDGNANACMILLFLYKLVEVRYTSDRAF